MNFFRNKTQPLSLEEGIPPEKRLDNRQLRKMDRYYIAIACVLGLSWAVWNFGLLGKLKMPDFNLNFAVDYFAEKAANKSNRMFMLQEYNYNAREDGEYIFYYQGDTRGLYRINKDGTNHKKILSGDIYNFEVYDGWIYYSQPNDGINKVRFDGSEKTKIKDLNSIGEMAVYGDYLYYYFGNSQLERISLKNGKTETISSNQGGSIVIPYGNWLYTIAHNANGIYKSRIGSDESKLAFTVKEVPQRFIGIYKGWLYYINNAAALWRCRLDGNDSAKVADRVMYYLIEGEKLYYSSFEYNSVDNESGRTINTNSKLFCSDLDGTNADVIVESTDFVVYMGNNLAIYNDPLGYGASFFSDISTGQEIKLPEPEYEFLARGLDKLVGDPKYSYTISGVDSYMKIIKTRDAIYYPSQSGIGMVRRDKSGVETVPNTNMQPYGTESVGNLIFYRSIKDYSLLCSTLDGKEEQVVFDFITRSHALSHEAIYFLDTRGKLFKAQFSDGKITKLAEDILERILVKDGFLYGLTPMNSKVIKMKLDGTKVDELYLRGDTNRFDIVDDYVYTLSVSDEKTRGIYRQRFGETKPEPVVLTDSPEYIISDKYILVIDYTMPNVNNLVVARYNLDGKNKTLLSLSTQNFYLEGDNLYYMNYGKGLVQSNIKEFIMDNTK